MPVCNQSDWNRGIRESVQVAPTSAPLMASLAEFTAVTLHLEGLRHLLGVGVPMGLVWG